MERLVWIIVVLVGEREKALWSLSMHRPETGIAGTQLLPAASLGRLPWSPLALCPVTLLFGPLTSGL